MTTGLILYSLYFFISGFPYQYNTIHSIHCKSRNKNSVCNKWCYTQHNSLENLNQFIDKFPKTSYSVANVLRASITGRIIQKKITNMKLMESLIRLL